MSERNDSGLSHSPAKNRANPQNTRKIMIAGSLLAFYRGAMTQAELAKMIDERDDAVSKFEEGKSRGLVQEKLGLIADVLGLDKRQIELLRGAAEADVLIDSLLEYEAPEKLLPLLRPTPTVPASEARHWLRHIFLENCADLSSKRVAEQARKEGKRIDKITEIGARMLVDKATLNEIRQKVRETCKWALRKHTPDNVSPILLFWARVEKDADHGFREQAREKLRKALEMAQNQTTRRHLSDGLCELGDPSAMCRYLKETEDSPGSDTTENLAYLGKISGDTGEGLETLGLVLRLINAHDITHNVPMLALDLRTAAQLIDNKSPSHELIGPNRLGPLENLHGTLQLRQYAEQFQQDKQPNWFSEHKCVVVNDGCAEIAHRYSEKLLSQIDDFGTAIADYFKKARKVPTTSNTISRKLSGTRKA